MKQAHTEHQRGVVSRFGTALLTAAGLSQQQETSTEVPEEPEPSSGSSAKPGSGEGGSDADEASAETDEQASDLPLDQVFEILKNSRRREALAYLKEHGGTASLSDLAEHIAALENDTTVDAISSSQRKRVYVGLYQCHLPKMDDMNIVEFDQNRGTVRLADNADQLDPYLEEKSEPAWHRVYATVTAAGGGLCAVSILGGAPLGLTPAIVLAALVVTMAACAGVHAVSADEEDGSAS